MKKIHQLALSLCFLLGLTLMAQAMINHSDSFVWNQEKESSQIKELTIRNSGFRSRATIVIRYRDEDKKIVEVIENGKNLTPSEFSRYESVMRNVLELPRINELLPQIDEALHRLESSHISEEARLDHIRQLQRSLQGMESDVARRHRDLTELRLMESYNRMIERIGESEELSREERIKRIKEIMQQIQESESTGISGERHAALAELEATNAARRMIEEVNRASEMSRQEKITEMNEIVRQMREINSMRREEGNRHRDRIEFEVVDAVRKMVEEINQNKELSDQEKQQEIESLLKDIDVEGETSESMRRWIGVEKFELELNRLLKEEGLFPEEEAEFILTAKSCSIAGKKVSNEVHAEILRLSKETMGKDFSGDSKIILLLNERHSR